jgi:hypothetical protein
VSRIDRSEGCDRRCFRSDHDQAREVNRRREVAHAKHGEHSIEALPGDDPRWLTVLVEEVGEVAHALTYDSDATQGDLVSEIYDVMTVASAWIDALRDLIRDVP